MKLIFLLLVLVSCSKKDSGSAVVGSQCPSTSAAPSNLPLAPAAETAVPIHSNGINTTWQIQLNGTLNTGYSTDVYDVDLFDTTAATITELKSSGKKVICYFSAGSSEDWRTDYKKFESADLGKDLDGWEGERWLDIRSQNVLDIMEARIELAVTKGCDAVDPDNMDGFTQDSCFSISANEQLAYNRAIANLARSKGLSVGRKNDPTQVAALEDYYDFSITEQCFFFSECDKYFPFSTASKPVFNIEYDEAYHSNPGLNSLCVYSNANNLQTLVRDLGLNVSHRHQCF